MVYLILWLIFGFIGYQIGKERKMGPTKGFLWGFLLGIIGLIVVGLGDKPEPTNNTDVKK